MGHYRPYRGAGRRPPRSVRCPTPVRCPDARWSRFLFLCEGEIGRDALAIEPAGDIESLRGAHNNVGQMTLPANQEIVLEGIQGNAIEIDTNDAPLVEINVLRSPGKEEFTRIAFYRERGYRNWECYNGWEREQLRAATDSLITLDSSYSSIAPDRAQSKPPNR